MAEQAKIIAVETTARRGGLALAVGEQVIAVTELAAQRDYAADLLPTAAEMCRSAGWSPGEIEQVYVSIGPGSFTGTRIGVTFAKSLALAGGAQVVAVPTFAAVARNALQVESPPADLIVLMDARKGQVFAERFRLHTDATDTGVRGYESVGPGDLVYLTDLLGDLPHPVGFVGEGVTVHRQVLLGAGGILLPEELSVARAEQVHRVGWELARQVRFTPVDALVPVYYRLPTPVERLQAKEAGREP
jgi:tRNA threonylcarbamoyladenosine biosynthesis protein TsaB